MSKITYEHETRVQHLSLLSKYWGYTKSYKFKNSYPDVLNHDITGGGLFIGDAKHSERPTNKITKQRLNNYFKEMKKHFNKYRSLSYIAICHGQLNHSDEWSMLLIQLAKKNKLPSSPLQTMNIAQYSYVSIIKIDKS